MYHLRIKNINVLILSLFIPSSLFLLSLCWSKFLTYIFSFSKKNLLLTFFARLVYWKQIFSFFVWEHLCSSSHLKDNFTAYRILDCFFFFLSTLNILLHSLLVWIVSERFDVIFVFIPLRVRWFFFILDFLYLRFSVVWKWYA